MSKKADSQPRHARSTTTRTSGDEVMDFWEGRKPKAKLKFAKLKKALAKHELPLKRKATATSSASNDEEQGPSKRARLNQAGRASYTQRTTWVTMQGDDLRRSAGFQKAMSNPDHPDFGFTFSAMAKEKKAITLAGTLEWWAVDGDDAEVALEEAAVEEYAEEDAAEPAVENATKTAIEVAKETGANDQSGSSKAQSTSEPSRRSGRQAAKLSALPSIPESVPSLKEKQPKKVKLATKAKPTKKSVAFALSSAPSSTPASAPAAAAKPAPLRITGIIVLPKYDLVSFETAEVMRDLGLDFSDLRVVGLFNRQVQSEDPNRPYRSQNSLLKVLKMTREEYFGS